MCHQSLREEAEWGEPVSLGCQGQVAPGYTTQANRLGESAELKAQEDQELVQGILEHTFYVPLLHKPLQK